MYPLESKMPSDPQNKADRPDNNVVSLHRAEFVASIEKKLSEARRFFSLHDYASCAGLVHEVLAADPQNSKAKALLELSSIKLSKRKLYKKIADPDSPGSDLGATLSTSPPAHNPRDPQQDLEGSKPNADPAKPISSSVVIDPPPHRRRPTFTESSPGLSQDSMRERTISALVDLLKNKESTVQDWKGSSQTSTLSPTSTSRSVSQREPGTLAATDGQFTSGPPGGSPQPLPASKHPRPPALQANRDFLPGSLDDLFETEPAQPATPPPVALTSVMSQKDVATTAALKNSSPDKSAEKTKVSQETHPDGRTASSKPPEVNPAPPPLVPRPPVTTKDTPKSPSIAPPAERGPTAPQPPPVPHVVQLPDIRIFDQITEPRPLGRQKEVERKIEQRSDEVRNSEIQAGAIAQIKKYLYQEEYDLCARDLARIRDLFPQNSEIQAFVENTSKRLVELQRIKKFELQARDLMASAVALYQEGKREEALVAVREILRVNPNHVQAREFVSFVERHQGKSRKKPPTLQKVRACRSCGSEVDAVSQFCYHCGKKL